LANAGVGLPAIAVTTPKIPLINQPQPQAGAVDLEDINLDFSNLGKTTPTIAMKPKRPGRRRGLKQRKSSF